MKSGLVDLVLFRTLSPIFSIKKAFENCTLISMFGRREHVIFSF